MPVHSKMTQLLKHFIKLSGRQDKSLDKYLVNFEKKLHGTVSNKSKNDLLQECGDKIASLDLSLDETLAEGRLIANQSQIQLSNLENLPKSITDKLKSVAKPYTITEYHYELTSLIKIYQRVVIELNAGSSKNCKKKNSLHIDISHELLQLIVNLDVSPTFLPELENIRKEIISGIPEEKISEYCLSVISLIINSAREERRLSRSFLYSLNDSLSQFYLDLSKSVNCALGFLNEQDACINEIKNESILLQDATINSTELIELKKDVLSYIDNVNEQIQLNQDQMESKDQSVRAQFEEMEKQIKELQNEAKGYQRTLKQQNQQLHIDFLTQIPNRSALNQYFIKELAEVKRYQKTLNIAVIDVDKFKRINDSFGHLSGDKVIKVIAHALQKSLRTTDYIARFGGEEFVVLLPNVTIDQAEIALMKLKETIKRIPFKFKTEKIQMSISIGCTNVTSDDSQETSFERADNALYKAKNNGRDQVVLIRKEITAQKSRPSSQKVSNNVIVN